MPKHKSGDAVAVVVGGCGVDIMATPQTVLQAGDSSPGTIQLGSGGVARNIAENLAKLGIVSKLFSVIGDDAFGRKVLADTAASGVDVSAVEIVKNYNTACYLAVADVNGESAQAISDMALFDSLDYCCFSTLVDSVQTATICIADANLPAAFLQWLAAQCDFTPLVCEAVSRYKCERLQPILSSLRLLKVNSAEACQLLGVRSGVTSSPEALAVQLLDCGVEQVLITLGEHGALLMDERGVTSVESVAPEQLRSTNGAGDALLAAFMAAYLLGHNKQTQLQWAMRAAAITCDSDSAVAKRLTVACLQ